MLVIVCVLAAGAAGVFSLRQLEIDAFPDTTPVQVQINTAAPALSPEEIEQQITFPLEQVLGGLPNLEELRSVSMCGFSQIYVIFKDGTDIYFARQLVNERLGTVELPDGIERPQLGPVATGLGEVFHYIVYGGSTDPTELRTVHEWVVKPPMRTVPGTAEINTWGGYDRQYQILLDPNKLIKFGLTFGDVIEAVQKNNLSAGGGSISRPSGMLLVQGLGRTESVEEIRRITITAENGVPVQVGDLGEVVIGHKIRRGAVTANGKGEVVLGLGFLLMGENAHNVTRAMREKLETIKPGLPPNIRVEAVDDRTELVDFVIETVRKNLFEGGLFVIAVLFAFLGNFRAAAIVALAIPLSMLFAFTGMYRFGIAASLLSLGAIDFGLVVDSSVVMIENCTRHLANNEDSKKPRLEIIREAAVEVRKPTMFGELIIMIVYLPILLLEGVEGKMFRPMALTVIFALMGSMILSLTLMPVLASFFLPKKISASSATTKVKEPLIMRIVQAIHLPILKFALYHKLTVMVFAACMLIVAFGMIAPHLGSEFMPRLSEGTIAFNVVRMAGTDLDESIRYNTRMKQILLDEFPDEVENVWSRTGTAEICTDPQGVEFTDMYATLKTRSQWKKAKTQGELAELMMEELRDLPGQNIALTQPIEMRLDEMTFGVRADLGIKLFGDDFQTLVEKGTEIEQAVETVAGAADVKLEQITGQPVLRIKVRQDQISRYGIPAQAVLDFVEAIGSKQVGEIIEGQMRFPLIVRLPEHCRHDPGVIGDMSITAPGGEQIPLSRLASVEVVEGPSLITREWGQRRITITANVRGRDLGSFVAEVQKKVSGITMPSSRYHVEYGGQFQHLQRVQNRLMIVVPMALLLIFSLLYVTYHNIVDTLRTFMGIPFAWVGGIVARWLRDMPFSISAAVGFIAVSGVAVLNDMIFVSYIRQLRDKGMELEEAVIKAAITRLRPILMTTLVASLGFLPMALSTGVGAEVQRPLATVVIGGVIGAMVMSLLVLRVLYMLFHAPITPKKKPEECETSSQQADL